MSSAIFPTGTISKTNHTKRVLLLLLLSNKESSPKQEDISDVVGPTAIPIGADHRQPINLSNNQRVSGRGKHVSNWCTNCRTPCSRCVSVTRLARAAELSKRTTRIWIILEKKSHVCPSVATDRSEKKMGFVGSLWWHQQVVVPAIIGSIQPVCLRVAMQPVRCHTLMAHQSGEIPHKVCNTQQHTPGETSIKIWTTLRARPRMTSGRPQKRANCMGFWAQLNGLCVHHFHEKKRSPLF